MRQQLRLLRLYLAGAGYRVEVARDGEEGFTKAWQLQPSLITLDLLLPKVDGWDLLIRLKGEPATRDIPVVIVSIVEEQGKGFALGAADYLVKPVSREEMLQALQRLNLTRPQLRERSHHPHHRRRPAGRGIGRDDADRRGVSGP